ncbi:hypothetical protein SISNIDRAFT_488940 [Sistotremastrum niveocremeum HHB9708]|uniref:Uncharacterized protein n=1 Tax=Sistotremastrum niveocremeum HHB9708 TaxID=1314777 RepID=A0A164QLF4_9AGAM|nr:hypothetical protein SISNIDRAFT_488940 [Sistotremastrum niveocremeum HHB9708]
MPLSPFQQAISANKFNNVHTHLAQLNELAQQKRVTLEWRSSNIGPAFSPVWQVYPVVNGEVWANYAQTAPNVQEASRRSADEVRV